MPLPAVPRGLAAALGNARHVVVLTGAGVSAESGVPTFREAATGLWASFDPLKLATPEAFDRDPALVWRWYRWRRELVARASPNPGHRALVQLESAAPEFTLITQNVDGLHRRAGSENVIEYHGNLFADLCSRDMHTVDCPVEGALPRCPECDALVRPGVVWFGEPIPESARLAAAKAARNCDLFLIVGTSGRVWPAAGLVAAAQEAGAIVAEINTDESELSDQCHFRLAAPSGRILPKLVDCSALPEG